MASNSRDKRLLPDSEPSSIVVELPDLLGGLVAVHEGHVAVHEDDLVAVGFVVALLEVILDHLQSLLSVQSVVDIV